jgi:hypothetical protein
MATVTHDGLAICVDCVMLIANGEGTDEHCALVTARWGARLVLACEDDCEGWFSWRDCDGCGSSLGGDRHAAVGFETVA